MLLIKNYYLFIIAGLLLLLSSCNSQDKKQEIELALKTYDRLILKMDADSIAMMYTADGSLGDMAHGRDSIRKFLSTFTNVKVLSASSTSDKIDLKKDTAVQTGRYSQQAMIDNADIKNPKGSYIATWIWVKGEGWKIKHMITKPDQ
jgi:ketosteroid isomerase-like protein